jgi:predicted transcriptional regulator
VPIRQSVRRDYVVCLDCGYRGKMLRRHLVTAHGLSAAHYRARWNLPRDHAMTAPGYSERRSSLAKQLGLGRPRKADETPTVPETQTATQPTPKRRGRPKSASV